EAVGPRCGVHEIRQLVGALGQIVKVEHAFRQATEEAQHAALKHVAPGAQQGRLRSDGATQRQQVGFVAAGAVQQQQSHARSGSAGLIAMLECQRVGVGHYRALSSWGSSIGGSRLSISARCGSSHGGNTSRVPRPSAVSSTVNPGPSVAISKSTPPGSRKEIEWNQNRSMMSLMGTAASL